MFRTLGIHYGMRVRRIILSAVARPAVQHSSILSHKRHDFGGRGGRGRGGAVKHNTCLIFSEIFSEIFSILLINQ